jgi:hypothetical protein
VSVIVKGAEASIKRNIVRTISIALALVKFLGFIVERLLISV